MFKVPEPMRLWSMVALPTLGGTAGSGVSALSPTALTPSLGASLLPPCGRPIFDRPAAWYYYLINYAHFIGSP